MNRQNIILLILENISDDDNIVEIVKNYLPNSDLEDLEDKLLEAHKTLYVRNENYYEMTVPHPANENGLKWTEIDSFCSCQIQILIF